MQFDCQNKSRKRSHSDTSEAQRAYKKPLLANTSTSKSATSSPDSTDGDREIARDEFFGDSSIDSETTEVETPDSVCCTDPHRDAQNPLPALGDFRVKGPNDLSPRIRESQQAFTIYTSAGISQRKYKGPSSLEAFAQWLHMDSHVLDKDLSEHFRQASQHCEQLDIPRSLSMPILCSKWTDYVDAYFQDVAPLFSVVGRENVIRAATYLSRFNTLEWRPICERPVMATVYACIALGARVKGHQEVAQIYIEAACSLTGYLSSFPQLESAQALLLIAIEHRGRSKSGAAFNAVRQAVSILNSMGLHRTPSSGNDHLTTSLVDCIRFGENNGS
ncbi:hypothetical protein E4T49_07754 [Aureobasidium sp. EXF-10728]|nr:hypothetical protein E4T49_07754 [Aureobasidium sp. EXF-10728]